MDSFLSVERNVLVMSLTAFLMNFGAQAFQPFIPLYLDSLNADVPQIGIVYVGIALATNLVSIPGGILADKVGRKAIIVIGNALGFGLFLLLLDVNTWTMALIVLFAATAFATLVQPAYSSSVAESVKVGERSRAFGTFFALVYLGLALGSVIGGRLSNSGKFELNIILIATMGLSAAGLRMIFLRETLSREATGTRSKPKERFFVRRLSRNVWLVLAVLLLYNFAAGLGQPLYALFSTKQLSLSMGDFGVMVGAGYLAAMFGAFGAGKVSKKLGVRRMMMISVILSGGLLLPWLYAPNSLAAIGFFAISGFFAQFFFVGNQTLMANITKPKERASIIGLITTTAGFGSIVAPYVGTQLWILLAPRTPFLISSLLAVAVVAPIALIREAQVKCPHCGRELPQEPRFCDMCGKPIVSKKCDACGRDLAKEARFCDACGRKQSELALTETPSREDRIP